MLTHIDIRNFTIIPTLSLEFSAGMTVLTGETGAGKSIILNALSLALGARAKKNLVREANKPAEITLSFQLSPDSLATHWLKEQLLDDGDDCIIRRIIHADGRTRSTINGRSCSLSMTKTLAEHLIHIHSQHQQQQLLKPSWQGECLDHVGKHSELLIGVKEYAESWQALQARIEQASASQVDQSHELALIEYQLEELEALCPQPDEWEKLGQQHDQLAQADTLRVSLGQCLELCRDNEQHNAQAQLQRAIDHLKSQLNHTPACQNALDLLRHALIHCEEASDELAQMTQSIESNEENLTAINQRLEQLSDVARKHQVKPEQLGQQLQTLKEKKHALTHLDEHVQALKQEQETILTRYNKQSQKLSRTRKRCAKQLGEDITKAIHELNMPGSSFCVVLRPRTDQPHALGAESIQFQLSTQPNTPPQALGEVASGGELSRITLTLMLATSGATQMPIFVFDEIDVGMGGQTAKLVGQLIRDLSTQSQVFCITHLPQVAAMGQHHFRVDKALDDEVVTSTIGLLNKAQRIEELARMTSGDQLTDAALAHASSLVVDAQENQT